MPNDRSLLFSWLNACKPNELTGTVCGIFIAPGAGENMMNMTATTAIAGHGLTGDRYAEDRGHWRATDACQVTLVTARDIQAAEKRSGLTFSNGEHRRNLVVAGIPLAAYRHHQVQIGGAMMAYHRLRPPCGYLDRIVNTGAGKALGRGAGIGLRVLRGGNIRLGDSVRLLLVSQKHTEPTNVTTDTDQLAE